MKSIPLHVLEGLIHNLRTPLNVIIGYAQKLTDNNSGKYIHESGIRMDDQLQQMLDSLALISDEIETQSLAAWLEAELCLLKNTLAIKRQFQIAPLELGKDVLATFSGTQLSSFTEAILLGVVAQLAHSTISLTFEASEAAGYKMIIALPQAPDNLMEEIGNICEAYSAQPHLHARAKLFDKTLSIEVNLNE